MITLGVYGACHALPHMLERAIEICTSSHLFFIRSSVTRIRDILQGDKNHSAQQCGAGVAALPPPALRKLFTHHAKACRARRAHRPDAQLSH